MNTKDKWTVGTTLSLCLALTLMAAPSAAHVVEGPEKDLLEKEQWTKGHTVTTDGPGLMSPGNDHFDDSVSVPSLPYTNNQSTVDATTEPDEPSPCGAMGATVWYDYTPSQDETVSADTFGSGYDTVLAIYTGGSVDSLTLVDCNDDSGSLQSKVSFSAVGGTTYRIQVGGFSSDTGQLTLNMNVLAPLDNDDFTESITVDSLPYTATQTTDGATTETDEPSPCAGIAGTVWYDFTPSADLSVAVDTFGSGYDTALAVYTGSSVDDLTLIDCNDDSGSLQSLVTFSASVGTTYRIQVGGFGGATGALTLNVDEFTPPTNDDRADAIAIEGLPYSNNQTTSGAGEEDGEPSPCAGIGSTVWYSYTASQPGLVTVDTFGSGYDTALAAYIEVAGQLVNIACNDDTGSLQSQIQFPAVPGVTVYIQVGGYFGDSGDLVLNAS